jgi:arylsulfatase A-like enzyme
MKKPNILIFMTDHQRGDSVLGRAIMPNSDRQRQQGVTFTETFCPAPHCCPARATFFTGLYPSQHNIWHNVNVGNAITRDLAEGVKTWGEDLQEAGYRMWYSGKWHVSHHESPADRGWNCCPSTGSDYSGAKTGNPWPMYKKLAESGLAVERGPDQIVREGYPSFTISGVSNEEKHGDTRVVREAAAKLEELTSEESDQPWCLYAGCIGPHDPYNVPQKYLDMYDINDIELPANFHDDMLDKPNFYRRTKENFDQLTEDEHKKSILHFLAYCTYEDALLGQLLDALEASGQADDTVVIATSDHGDYMGEHGLWAKGVPCFRGAYHVPMIVRWTNGLANPGRDVDEMISLADIAPTMLELADVETDREFVGESLVPFLKDETVNDWRDMMFTQTNGNELYAIQRACFDKDFKMVYNGFDYDELYDLRKDPHELKNVVNDPEYKDVVRRMMKRIWGFAYETDDVCINPYIMVRFAQYGPGIAFEE